MKWGIALLFGFYHFIYAQGTPSLDDIEYPDDEEPTVQQIELGKKLFFDNRLSVNKDQSCATCHNPNLGFSDGVAFSLGAMGGKVGRNTPHLYNLAFGSIFFWDGRAATLEEQALGPIEAAGEMNMPLDEMEKRLNSIEGYKKLFKAAYGVNKITRDEVASAIASFERTIVSDNSPYDQYLKGDKDALKPQEVKGMELFFGKARCVKCHSGPNFTDDSFHNLGLGDKDEGRAAVIKDKKFKGAFKTPGLRNITQSAPYMHNGSLKTLEDVVVFYNTGGAHSPTKSKEMKSLGLTKKEIYQVVMFLGALTDPVIIKRPQLPK